MLRQFVSSTRSDEEEDPLQVTLWIYTPDYDNFGQIKPINNITTARSDYAPYWTDLDQIKTIEESNFPQNLMPSQVTALQHWLSFDQIETLEVKDDEFMNLLDFKHLNNYDKLKWAQVTAIQSLVRSMFPNELYWRENDACSGYTVSDKPECVLRTEEMKLIMYTPAECSNGSIKNCEQLITYTRVQVS